MIDIWKKAKDEKQVLHFQNFYTPEISWQNALDFVYTEYASGRVKGRPLPGYFFLQDSNLFIYDGFSGFMEKINGVAGSEECIYYKEPVQDKRRCSCSMYWHMETLRVSVTNHTVPDHLDDFDVLYWQLIGNSYWTINKDKTYKLEPGDLLYFNKEDSHAVEQDGPRCGLILFKYKNHSEQSGS